MAFFLLGSASADRQLYQPGFMAPYASTNVASAPQMYAPAPYAYPAAYEAYENVQAPYAYPGSYEYVVVEDNQSTSGWSDMAMLAVAGAAVGAAIGYATKKPAEKTASRAGTPEMKAALLYSTTTGNTETAAGYIAAATGLEPVDIGDVDVETLKECDSLICGAPTWHTGADSERSGTAWDEFLYGDLTGLDCSGKKVAIFGMGDQAGYADNYCDAMDELKSCFEKQGATVVGAWPTDGYEHEESKSIADGKFVGCPFDEDNQPDMSEERANKWVEQIKGEGITI
jgi:flavodoxin I